MKRDHNHFRHPPTRKLDPRASSSSPVGTKGKMLKEEDDGGMDELLAVLGYKVRSSDMAEVAQKLEQLEEIIGNVQDEGLSNLASETVHFNPSELSTWLGSMLSELNPVQQLPLAATAVLDPVLTPLNDSLFTAAESSAISSIGYEAPRNRGSSIFDEPASSDYDLKAIPGNAIYPPADNQFSIEASSASIGSSNKRLKPSRSDSTFLSSSPIAPPLVGEPAPESTRPVVLVDSQENGIRLVHVLMAGAEAVQQNNLTLAEALVKQIGFLAVSQAGAMRKVATCFAEALARRIYRLSPPQKPLNHSLSDALQLHFYETCPYLKFAHFTANQAILEAFEGKKHVHVIDFSMNQGLQWPALIQALALRPGGPPVFRLTGIGPPAPDNSDYLKDVGLKLAQLAETIQVEFEYRGFLANSVADLDAAMLQLRPSETESVAVNSVFELHKLLARPGSMENVLDVVKQMKPAIFTVVEQESNHNSPVFLDRFTESLHYYSTLFDSLEGVPTSQDKVMSEVYLGEQICNVLACDGVDRVERHELLTQWRNRFSSAGFLPVPIGSNAFKQASMLLALFNSRDGYRVEEKDGCLTLGWHTRPLIATSAWKLAGEPVVAH